MQYKHLFFDLDHTLWDFEANSKAALTAMYYDLDLRQLGILSPEQFVDVYLPINYKYWAAYREGRLSAEAIKFKRFEDTYKKFGGASEKLIQNSRDYYLKELPKKGALMPNVLNVLGELKNEFQLHVVTNGFRAVTKHKMERSKLVPFFNSVLSAEDVGVLKPNKKVFETALINNNAQVQESLFIGDNLIADVQGARSVGMDQVYFNPEKEQHSEDPTYEIHDMIELLPLLE